MLRPEFDAQGSTGERSSETKGHHDPASCPPEHRVVHQDHFEIRIARISGPQTHRRRYQEPLNHRWPAVLTHSTALGPRVHSSQSRPAAILEGRKTTSGKAGLALRQRAGVPYRFHRVRCDAATTAIEVLSEVRWPAPSRTLLVGCALRLRKMRSWRSDGRRGPLDQWRAEAASLRQANRSAPAWVSLIQLRGCPQKIGSKPYVREKRTVS
jgi:hypothetical protein